MHTSVISFVGRALTAYDVDRKRLLEVGSRNINGSGRRLAFNGMAPESYLGIDMLPGPGVDVVMKAEELPLRYPPGTFETLLCLETLEHVEFWRAAVLACKLMLAPDGILIMTTRSPGFPLHAYPSDFWRFTVEDFRAIFADFEILILEKDPQEGHPGVFLKARKPKGWKPANLDAIQVKSVG